MFDRVIKYASDERVSLIVQSYFCHLHKRCWGTAVDWESLDRDI